MTVVGKARRRGLGLALCLGTFLAAVLAPGAAHAATGPVYDVRASWGDTHLAPGGKGQFELQVRNVGDAVVAEDLVIEDELPAGLVATNVVMFAAGHDSENLASKWCIGTGTGTVRCALPAAEVANRVKLYPNVRHYLPQLLITVNVPAEAAGSAVNTARVSGGGAAEFVDEDEVFFDPEPSPFGIRPGSFRADLFTAIHPFGEPARQAGDRPFELRVDFEITQHTGLGNDGTRFRDSNGLLRTVEVTLPRGVSGNPEATPKCDPVDFTKLGASAPACPPDTQVGYLSVPVGLGEEDYGRSDGKLHFANPNAEVIVKAPIYNVEPPRGQVADFAFNAAGLQAHIYPVLDPAQDYAIKFVTPNISNFSLVKVRSSEVTGWGVPGDPAHDRYRRYQQETEGKLVGAPWGSAPIRPILTAPVDCGFDNGSARIRVDSYEDPGHLTQAQESADPLNVTGCDDPRFRFEPDVSLQPTTKAAGDSTGLTVHLEIPQRNDEVKDATDLYAQNGKVKAIPTPPMKKAVVTLPEGMTVNPAAAQGLGHCTPAQIGLGTDRPVTCPDNSQFGTLTLHTPVFPADAQPEGWVYVASQNDNPFHNFLSLYLVIQEPERGILVKVPGRVDLDPRTGQITTTFDDLPQFPMSDMEMNIKGGLRAGLVNPQTCGTKTIEATFYSWHDPSTPHTVTDSYEVTHNPDGSPCRRSLAERPFDPSFAAGTLNPLAGSYSPMELAFSRTDEDQEFLAAEGAAPEGLTASLRGMGRCSEAQIAAAADPARSGAEESASPSCPASSLVGTVDASAGVGQVRTWVEGKVYLAGPYKGAPASGVAIVPAVAGPFDLGIVVTRAPAYIDPVTARLSLKTDPLPLIFKGVPVRVRDVRVHLDRPGFALNPTSCEEMTIEATLRSSEGRSKDTSNRFQAADCASLDFRPRLALRVKGGTRRGAHPSLIATYRPRPDDANTSRLQVTLPRSAFLDQAHIRTICTRVQFAAGEGNGAECPAGSVYGHVTAWTPLLDEPLTGNVYLRSSDNNLPDMVAAVSGPPSLPVRFESAARIDSVGGAIRSTFTFFPDVPLSKAVLRMQGGKKGLIVNSRGLCSGKAPRARAGLAAHNGRRALLRPKLRSRCKAKRRARRAGHRSRGR